MIAIRCKTRVTGPTIADDAKAMVQEWIDDAVNDLRETPTQFKGTPYKKTGELVRGLFFKPAAGGSKTAGILGTVYAPLSRFAGKFVKQGFIALFEELWRGRGVGWSRKGEGR